MSPPPPPPPPPPVEVPAPTGGVAIVSPNAFTGTFARASTGTYRDAATGNLLTAAANTARYQDGALLLEGTRSNSRILSDIISAANYWPVNNAATLTLNAGAAPTGANVATLLTTGTGGSSGTYCTNIGTANGVLNTVHIYAKNVSGADGIRWGGETHNAVFNLITGVVTPNVGTGTVGYMTPAGNGWWRLSVTWVATGTSTSFSVYKWNSTAAVQVLLWGMHIEVGGAASSHISVPGTSTVTRAADIATLALTTPQQATGTLYTRVRMGQVMSPTPRGILTLDDGTTTNRFGIQQGDGTGATLSAFRSNGAAVAGGVITPDVWTKAALSWDANGFYTVLNGGSEVQNLGALPTVNRLLLADAGFLEMSALDIYPTRLTTAQMQTLTA